MLRSQYFIGFHILCDLLSIVESLDLFLETITRRAEALGQGNEPGVRAGYQGPVVSQLVLQGPRLGKRTGCMGSQWLPWGPEGNEGTASMKVDLESKTGNGSGKCREDRQVKIGPHEDHSRHLQACRTRRLRG